MLSFLAPFFVDKPCHELSKAEWNLNMDIQIVDSLKKGQNIPTNCIKNNASKSLGLGLTEELCSHGVYRKVSSLISVSRP